MSSPTVKFPPEIDKEPARKRIGLEALGKNVALFGVACYVIGLLTVNAYLFQLGVSDFSPVNPRFVSTGVLVLASMVIAIAPPIIGIWTILYSSKRSKNINISRYQAVNTLLRVFNYFTKDIMQRWLIGLMFILSPLIIYGITLLSSGRQPSFTWILYLLFTVFFTCTIAAGIIFDDQTDEVHRPQMYRIGTKVSGWFFFTIFALAYLSLFSWHLYPAIPEQFGGGQPKQVRLLFDENSTAGARELGIPIANNVRLSDPVTVLFDGNDSYILRIQSGQVVRVDKKTIQGVRIENTAP